MRRLKDTCQLSRNLRIGESGNRQKPNRRLQFRHKNGSVEIESSDYSYLATSAERYQLISRDVSDELGTMIVLFLASKVPAGVLADRLQEEHPDLEWVSNLLREWDQLEGP